MTQTQAQHGTPVPSPAAPAVNILLVDDQPARLLTYETILADLGQNLVRARSGIEALQRLMKDEFAVVLLDVSMPEMDGFETAALIHEHPRFERTPIIFVTGVAVTELDRLKGYKLGAVDYVSIPVVPEILRSKVAVLVELHLKRRELQRLNRALAETNRRLEYAHSTLQAEKTRELEALNRDLQRAIGELEMANSSLKNEVRERARAQQALKQADQQKDEFLATLAHELRNPLAAIHNAVQLMRHRPAGDPKVAWSREIIERQLAQLTRLVDDLLDVSRITRGKINLNPEVLPLETLIARAVETVQAQIEERQHALTLDLPPAGARVLGDPMRLNQALANILGNAAKYTDRGGRIHIAARVLEGQVEIRVCDNGIGIEAQDLPAIFDLFTQGDHGEAGRGQSGLGIGLALVRRLVEMHGGTVQAQSEGAGRGSEFTMRLPLFTGHAEANTTAPAAVPQPASGRPGTDPATTPASGDLQRHILVADDNADALETLAMLLELSGHRVVAAGSGHRALELAARHRPEVALLDIGMPDLDGCEVARRIRAEPWGASMCLVALTGWGQDSDRRQSREAGFDAHLVKPLDLRALTEVLCSLPRPAPVAPPPGMPVASPNEAA